MLRNIYSFINSKLQKLACMTELEQVQALVIKSGLFSLSPVISKIIAFASLSPTGSLSYAQAIFEETTMDDPFICNIMIRGYTKSVFPIKAINIYNHMQVTNVESDHFTYNFVLTACARVVGRVECDENSDRYWIPCKGREIHSRILKLGFGGDLYIQNSLVSMYSQCGLVVNARQLFDEMTERSVASWNIMISAYDKINDYNSADFLFEMMPRQNVVSWNTLLARYVRLGDITAARRVFQGMSERNTASWNSMIAGYVQIKNYAEALELFHKMRGTNVEGSEITLISILGACAESGALRTGKEIHEFLKKKNYRIEGYLGVALVDMYAKCGDLFCAQEVFNNLKMKPIGCWNAMIVGFAIHGHSEKALELFAAMELNSDEIRPNRVTFIGVLIACSHKGLVKEARQFFNLMINAYKIAPDIKHYGCMVDLLSRWGLLVEAYQMIKSMPFGANPILWRTLLSACKVYNNVNLAKECFQELAQLESLTDSDYVLLSNIFAEAEKWDDVEWVRNQMLGRQIPKKHGSSRIDMHNSAVHITS